MSAPLPPFDPTRRTVEIHGRTVNNCACHGPTERPLDNDGVCNLCPRLPYMRDYVERARQLAKVKSFERLAREGKTDYAYYNGCRDHVYGCPADCPTAESKRRACAHVWPSELTPNALCDNGCGATYALWSKP